MILHNEDIKELIAKVPLRYKTFPSNKRGAGVCINENPL